MKNKLLLILTCSIFMFHAEAQLCTDIPISFSSDSIYFLSSDGFGDSMFVFTMLNEHATQGFAYPQAKLEPVTPLPSGMSLNSINDPWAVYASSWNPGQYSPVHIYYDVEDAIPEDYTVTFKLWINNLSPVTDSCSFDDIITINLNPSAATGIVQSDKTGIAIYPNPATNGNFTIRNIFLSAMQFRIYESTGKLIYEGSVAGNESTEKHIEQPGIYFLTGQTENEIYNFQFVVD